MCVMDKTIFEQMRLGVIDRHSRCYRQTQRVGAEILECVQLTWAECVAEQLSTSCADTVRSEELCDSRTDPEIDRKDKEIQSKLALAYTELKTVARENYLNFDWNAWAEAACLVQQEAECFYTTNLLSNDFQSILDAYSLDIKLANAIAVAKQLVVDFNDRIRSLGEELCRAREKCPDELRCDTHSELEANASKLLSAWKKLSVHIRTLEKLSNDIQLAYSPQAVEAAKQYQLKSHQPSGNTC